MQPPKGRSALNLSVCGLQQFVTFCIELDDLLRRTAPYPLLQSAQWHYFGYWFECIREKIGRWLNLVMERVRHWSPREEDERRRQQAKQAIDTFLTQVMEALQRLLSPTYGEALRARKR